MPKGRRTSLSVRLSPEERAIIDAWQRATRIPAWRAKRGRILLLIAEGHSVSRTALLVGISRRFVYKWARRFLAQGLAGLADQPRPGARGRTRGTAARLTREGGDDDA